MKLLVLDVETLAPPQPNDQFAALPLHDPAVICWFKVNAASSPPKMAMTLHSARGAADWEAHALSQLAIDGAKADRLITFNGRGFDLPLLGMRAMKHQIDWQWWTKRRHRFGSYYQELYHYDLQEQIGDFGATRHFGLDGLSKLLGFPGKGGIDGSKVRERWLAGGEADVEKYCMEDVFHTWMVYLAWARSYEGEQVQALWHHSLEWAVGQGLLDSAYASASSA